MRTFSVDEARVELARLRPAIDEMIELRAYAAELAAAVQLGGPPTSLGWYHRRDLGFAGRRRLP